MNDDDENKTNDLSQSEIDLTQSEIELTQLQIEEMASLSLGDIRTNGDFDFKSQRLVAIDLRFTKKQDMVQISIFSDFDKSIQTPINLLETGVLHNSFRYRTMLAVPTFFDSLIVVQSGAMPGVIEINIDQNDRVHYLFEDR